MTARVYLGDYRDTLDHVRADLICTSPPYNIGSKAPRQDGQRKHGKYDNKSFGAIREYADTLPEDVYQRQQAAFFLWAASHLAPGGVLVYNHKPRRRAGTMVHPAQWFLRPEVRLLLTLVEEVVWDRGSTHNHGRGLLWPQTERLYVFRRAIDSYRFENTSALAQRSDVWRIVTREPSNGHNAPFPIVLASAIVIAWSTPGDLVVDPYTGSGTTGVAAVRLGRQFEGAEVLPKYHTMATMRLTNEREKGTAA